MNFRTRTIAIIAACVFSMPVLAQQGSNADANSQSGAAASNQGNEQRITIEGSSGSKIPRQAPSVVAPALTTTLSETCMGSTSVGASAAGFGLSFGSTWRDEACIRRLDARELRSFGAGLPARDAYMFHIAATERMCEDPKVRAAFERTAKRLGSAAALCQTTSDQRMAMKPGDRYVTRQDIDGEDHRGAPHTIESSNDSASTSNSYTEADPCDPGYVGTDSCNEGGP